jgi:hypothetical protein
MQCTYMMNYIIRSKLLTWWVWNPQYLKWLPEQKLEINRPYALSGQLHWHLEVH